MRIYAVRRSPARFAGFGQADVPPASVLLPTLLPGATPVTDDRQTIDARDRIVFREKNNLVDIAYLGTIAPPVTIGPARGQSTILLGYVYGPNAGTARYVPLEDFYRQGWWAADPKQDGKIWEAGGIYKKPVYPYTIADLEQNLGLIESWVKNGLALAEAGDVAGARHALSQARDNINNAWYRLGALRDSGLPFELVESLSTLVRGVAEKTGPLTVAINEADAGAMAKIGRAILDHFSSVVPKVNRVFSAKEELIKKKVIELYQLRRATDRLLRELIKLPQTGDGPKIVATLASELAILNRDIASMEGEAAKHGMKLSVLFDIPKEYLSDLGAWFVPVIWIIVDIIVSIIIWKLLDRYATRHADVLAKDEVQKANKISQAALVEMIRLNFEKIITEHPTMNFDTAKELAVEYARISAQLANMDELKQIIDPKLLKTITDGLNKRGIVVGAIPGGGDPGSKQPGAEAAQDDTLILLVAGIAVLGPILASLFKKS